MQQRTFRIDGYDLHYEQVAGDDPPIVCLPGFTNNSTDFHGIVEHLGRTNVYAIDVWGQGRSPWIGDYSRGRDIAAIGEFLRTVSGPAVLVGYSRGGLLSYELAASQPGSVRGVYAIDVTPFFPENKQAAAIPFLSAVFALDNAVRPFRQQTRSLSWLIDAVGDVPVPPDSTLRQFLPPDVLAGWARQLADCDPEIWTALRSPAGAAPRSAADTFASTSCPLHLAYGDTALGSVVMTDEPQRFLAATQSCTATAFPGHGHGIHQQSPAALAGDLRSFLDRHHL